MVLFCFTALDVYLSCLALYCVVRVDALTASPRLTAIVNLASYWIYILFEAPSESDVARPVLSASRARFC